MNRLGKRATRWPQKSAINRSDTQRCHKLEEHSKRQYIGQRRWLEKNRSNGVSSPFNGQHTLCTFSTLHTPHHIIQKIKNCKTKTLWSTKVRTALCTTVSIFGKLPSTNYKNQKMKNNNIKIIEYCIYRTKTWILSYAFRSSRINIKI